jgi:hypothetical protein
VTSNGRKHAQRREHIQWNELVVVKALPGVRFQLKQLEQDSGSAAQAQAACAQEINSKHVGTYGEVAALAHEPGDDAVERGALQVPEEAGPTPGIAQDFNIELKWGMTVCRSGCSHKVERPHLEVQLLASAANTSLARAQLTEVLRGAGNDVLAQLHDAVVTGNIMMGSGRRQ